MTPLFADHAEEVVAACAVASRHGALLARDRVLASAFRDPRARGLFTAALSCDLQDQDDRVHDCSLDAHVDPAWTARIVGERPVQWDTSGSWAARVAGAAESRRSAERLLVELEELGVTVDAVELIA